MGAGLIAAHFLQQAGFTDPPHEDAPHTKGLSKALTAATSRDNDEAFDVAIGVRKRPGFRGFSVVKVPSGTSYGVEKPTPDASLSTNSRNRTKSREVDGLSSTQVTIKSIEEDASSRTTVAEARYMSFTRSCFWFPLAPAPLAYRRRAFEWLETSSRRGAPLDPALGALIRELPASVEWQRDVGAAERAFHQTRAEGEYFRESAANLTQVS